MKTKEADDISTSPDPVYARNSDDSPQDKKKSFFPKRRSIPDGFDFDLDEVWLPKFQRKPLNRSCRKSNDDALCRTVPAEYYSRHQLLKAGHTIQPSLTASSGNPVYTYKPGADKPHNCSWPSRAHDGTATNRKEVDQSHCLGENNSDSDMFDF